MGTYNLESIAKDIKSADFKTLRRMHQTQWQICQSRIADEERRGRAAEAKSIIFAEIKTRPEYKIAIK